MSKDKELSEESKGRSKGAAKSAIESGGTANCWICEDVFRRRRETWRYCHTCDRGFCEGEHGNFAYGVGKCVICGARKRDKT